MIDAGRLELHVLVRNANLSRHEPGGLLDAVAQTHGIAPQPVEIPTDHRHRIDVVEQERVRRQLAQIRDDVPKDGGRAEKAEDATGTERIADSLVDSVAAGNLDVEPVRLQPTNLECHDDVISTIESLPLFGR